MLKPLQTNGESFCLKLGKNKNTNTNQIFNTYLYRVFIENVPLKIFKKTSDVVYVFQVPP